MGDAGGADVGDPPVTTFGAGLSDPTGSGCGSASHRSPAFDAPSLTFQIPHSSTRRSTASCLDASPRDRTTTTRARRTRTPIPTVTTRGRRVGRNISTDHEEGGGEHSRHHGPISAFVPVLPGTPGIRARASPKDDTARSPNASSPRPLTRRPGLGRCMGAQGLERALPQRCSSRGRVRAGVMASAHASSGGPGPPAACGGPSPRPGRCREPGVCGVRVGAEPAPRPIATRRARAEPRHASRRVTPGGDDGGHAPRGCPTSDVSSGGSTCPGVGPLHRARPGGPGDDQRR